MEFWLVLIIVGGIWWIVRDKRRERKANDVVPDDWFEKFEEDLKKWQRR